MFKEKLFALFCVILMLAGASLSHAGTPGFLLGNWAGATYVDEEPVAVDMAVTLIKPNVKGGKFHYGEPRACYLHMAYVISEGDLHWFALSESNGGFCDKLDGRKIKFAPAEEESSIHYELSMASGRETGTLRKQ